MAISWLTVLQNVPWSEVVSNAPKVADGAKRLWNAVAKKPSPESVPADETEVAQSPETQIASMQPRLAALELAVADLQQEMLSTSEVIKALADQNAQLIHRIETIRKRVLWLSGALAACSLAATAALVLIFTG